MTPNGASTCQRAGTGAADCGAGITAGQPLQFQLLYSSGSTTGDEQKWPPSSRSEAQAGVAISLKSEPFNTLIATVGRLQRQPATRPRPAAGSWSTSATTRTSCTRRATGNFDTDGNGNQGGYSSAEEDTLINTTEYGCSAQTSSPTRTTPPSSCHGCGCRCQKNIQVYKSNLAASRR